MYESSGVGVLDKAMVILDALAAGPAGLGDLVERTGLPRATAHRLAVALERHRLVARDERGRFLPGPRLAGDPLLDRAGPVLERLRDACGESAQLYRRTAAGRVCVAAAERLSGLRTTVPVGSVLPLTAGSAAQALVASDGEPPAGSVFTARQLVEVRRRGWAQSVGEREAGVASVSAPVLGPDGAVVAAVSVSGPVERMTRSPGRRHGQAVAAAARELSG